MTPRRLSRIAAVPCLLALLAAPAFGFEWSNTCRGPVIWNTDRPTMEPSAVDFPFGSVQRDAVEQMRAAWGADAPGSVASFAYTYVATDAFVSGDNRNSIVIATPAQWTFGGALAVAVPRLSTTRCRWWPLARPRIIEQDVVFNPAPAGGWDFRVSPPAPHPQGPFNLALVGVHELGHVLGLDHENDVLSTLDEFYENGGVISQANIIQPHADDIEGIRSAYGSVGTQRDVAASAFERVGGGTSDPIAAPGLATPNAPVTFGFTMENRGNRNLSSIRVEFYLSTDDTITTGDTFLGASTFSMNTGTLATRLATVTIPGTVTAGNYHLGFIVDPDDTINEVDEGNNAAALIDPTTVTAAAAPTACCTYNPDNGPAPLSVSFNASCSSDPNGGVLTYDWDFDDGSTGTGVAVSHTFFDSGFADVILTVTDSTGLSDTEDCPVEVWCEDGEDC